MTLYEKRLKKEIKQRYDGLSENAKQKLIEYYFNYLGGEGGCEECIDTHCLCFDCELQLNIEAIKLTEIT